MSNIKTYDDLVAEEKRLEALLYSHKEAIKSSFMATKKSLNPLRAAADTARNLFTRSKSNPLMKFGVDFGVDVFFKKFVLAKAGWFTKIVLPFVLKNYSTYMIRERRSFSIFNKISGLFRKRDQDVKYQAADIKDRGEIWADTMNGSVEDGANNVTASSPNPF